VKLLLLIPIFYLLTDSSEKEGTYYYFCISRPTRTNGLFNTVLYTDIKDTVCNRTELHSLSLKWANFVNDRCGNSQDCTSDFSYFITKQQAEKNLNNAIKTYENLYKLEKVNF
jgi:hypothetical protein